MLKKNTYEQFCGSGFGIRCLFYPGSGIGFFGIPYPGSQPHIFYSLMTNFCVKSTIILSVLANIFFTRSTLSTILWYLWLQKMVGQIRFFLFFWCCCWIRNPGMDKNQDPGSGINIPDPQHCLWVVPPLIISIYLYFSINPLLFPPGFIFIYVARLQEFFLN